MKKLLVLNALILFSGITFSQTLEKGNLIGQHVMEVYLNPDVTYNQMQEFIKNKLIPAFEKQFGCKAYHLKGIRGVNKHGFGMLYIYESENARDKFYNEDGSRTELGDSAMEKVWPVLDELTNTIGEWEFEYTDWIVQ